MDFDLYEINDGKKYRKPMTEGEWRVGVSFNPSNNVTVDHIKAATAELIDLLEGLKTTSNDPRSLAKAQTEYEDAAMWAVKAVTKGIKS